MRSLKTATSVDDIRSSRISKQGDSKLKLTNIKRKIAVAGAGALAVGLITASVGVGGFSLFNNSQSQSATDNTGTVVLGLTAGQGAGFSQAVSAMAPDDYIQREVVLNNTGSVGVAVTDIQAAVSGCTMAGASTACSSTPLISGDSSSAPMQVFGQVCPSGAISSTEINSSGEYTYTCSSTWSTAFGAPVTVGGALSVPSTGSVGYASYSGTPVSGDIVSPTPLTLPTTTDAQGISEVIPPGKSVDVVLTSYLPNSADNTFQANGAVINYTFTISGPAAHPAQSGISPALAALLVVIVVAVAALGLKGAMGRGAAAPAAQPSEQASTPPSTPAQQPPSPPAPPPSKPKQQRSRKGRKSAGAEVASFEVTDGSNPEQGTQATLEGGSQSEPHASTPGDSAQVQQSPEQQSLQ
jgi:hypothetical protein